VDEIDPSNPFVVTVGEMPTPLCSIKDIAIKLNRALFASLFPYG
jgi:hypothetical protein